MNKYKLCDCTKCQDEIKKLLEETRHGSIPIRVRLFEDVDKTFHLETFRNNKRVSVDEQS